MNLDRTIIRKKICRARRIGFWNVGICLVERACNWVLYVLFRFDRWHGRRPYQCTNYKKIVIELSHHVGTIGTAVDIGCGLGDLLGRVHAGTRYGFDIDTRALACARLLHIGSGIQFIPGSFAALPIAVHKPVDLLMVTNWLHTMSDEWVKQAFTTLLSKQSVRYIIVDEVSYQHGRMESLIQQFATIIEVREDWQDEKRLFLCSTL